MFLEHTYDEQDPRPFLVLCTVELTRKRALGASNLYTRSTDEEIKGKNQTVYQKGQIITAHVCALEGKEDPLFPRIPKKEAS